jgi:hypothetical protein
MDNASKDTVVSLREGDDKNEAGTKGARRRVDQPLPFAVEPNGGDTNRNYS